MLSSLCYIVLSLTRKARSTVRMFIDLSSAFNTIQPVLLRDKLERTAVDHQLAVWTLGYLMYQLLVRAPDLV